MLNFQRFDFIYVYTKNATPVIYSSQFFKNTVFHICKLFNYPMEEIKQLSDDVYEQIKILTIKDQPKNKSH